MGRRKVKRHPRIPDPEVEPHISVPEAGALFGLGRAASYAAYHRGDIAAFWMGGKLVVPTAPLLVKLGLRAAPTP
jgi:hypothetical protein